MGFYISGIFGAWSVDLSAGSFNSIDQNRFKIDHTKILESQNLATLKPESYNEFVWLHFRGKEDFTNVLRRRS